MSNLFDNDPDSPSNKRWRARFSDLTWNITAAFVAILLAAGVFYFIGLIAYAIFHGF